MERAQQAFGTHLGVCGPDELCNVEPLPPLPAPPFAHLKTGAINGDVTSWCCEVQGADHSAENCTHVFSQVSANHCYSQLSLGP